VSDMNAKYVNKQAKLPFMGVLIDATPANFKECLKACKETKPTELNHWRDKVAETFKANKRTNNAQVENVVTALSVRSSWDLYF
jgi:hypothetical protein